MKKTFTILIAAIAALMLITQSFTVMGQVVSGTTYSITSNSTNSLPTNWSGVQSHNTSAACYLLTYSTSYIQTSNFVQYGFSSIKLKARKYGGPSNSQLVISVSWYNVDTKAETVLGTISPSSTTLSNYTISSPANVSAGNGYIKIQCKNASGGKGSGVSEVTITYKSCTPSTSTLAFGEVEIGDSDQKSFTLTTAGLTNNLTLSTGVGSIYSVSPTSINQSATSTTVTVTCAPTEEGPSNGTLTISGGGLSADVTVALTATGVNPSTDPTCTVDPDIYDFGNVAVNGSKSQTFTVTTANLTDAIALSMSSDKYTVEPNEIAQNATSTEVTITFLPTATGPVEAYLRVNGSGFGYEQVAHVSGTGATPYTITLHPGTGSCATASMSGISGATINLPAATPSSACSAMGWEFYGWATSSVGEATTAPSIVNNSYTISGAADLYAVYRDGGTKTFNFADLASANEWTNGTAYTSIELSPITLEAQGGGNNGKYYTSDKSWRMYNGGTVAISSDSSPINSVSSSPNKTFTISNGSASLSCTETINFTSIAVSYGAATPSYATSPSCTPTCVTPAFTITGVNKTGDTYYVTANIALSSTTEDASIYYTLNGDAPSSSSTLYEAPFDITATKTIKAIAIKDGYNNSSVAEKTITIVQPNVATFTDGVYSDLNSTSHLGSFYTYSVSGDENWYWNTTYNCAYIKGNSNTNEDWLISPKMNSVNKLAIAFKAVGKDGNSSTITVLYSTDYPGYGNPNSYTWNSITTSPTVPTSASSWTFQDISCSIPVNGDVYIAFKYISNSTNSGQFEMKDFTAKQCYPVTYAANGGTGSMADSNSPYAVGAEVTTLNNTFTAPTGQQFERWSDGTNNYAEGAKFTMPNNEVVLSAQWITPCTDIATMDATEAEAVYDYNGGNKRFNLHMSSKVSVLGGCDITEYGFVYSTSQSTPTLDNATKLAVGSEYTTANTVFEASLENVTGTYYVRAFATNAAGTAYSTSTVTVEVPADFPTWTVTYNENGNTSHTQTIYKGDTEDLEEPANAAPANMTFAGWAENSITKFSESAPEYVTEYEATDDKTFYAVYEYNCQTGEITKGWKRVEDEDDLAVYDQVVIASQAEGKVASSTISSSVMGQVTATFDTENGIMTELSNGAAILTLGKSSNNWTFTNSSNELLGATAVKKVAWDSGTTTWSISISDGAATIQNGTSSYGRFLHNVNSTRFTTYTSDPNVSMLLPQIYRYEDIAATKSYYVTSVTELAEASTITGTTKLESNITLNSYGYTVNGILDADGYLFANKTNSLIILDGGQLVTNNAVQATVKKEIAAWSTNPVNGWYFIALPIVATDYNPSTAGLITDTYTGEDVSQRTYDLYKYVADHKVEEVSKPWVNYRAHTNDFVMANGQGYLYANASSQMLEFAGTVKPYSESNNKVTLAKTGWNLIGNPFTCDVVVNKAFNVVNNASVPTPKDVGSTINPCVGIAVYGNENEEVTFTMVSSPDPEENNHNHGNLQMVLAQTVSTRGGENTAVLDNAMVSFNEGSVLPKFYFGTQNANLYILQDNEEYAIVSSNAQGEMPVNFRAYETGEYTITVNPEEVEMGYLHLIDNIAGQDIDLLATPSYTFNARTDDYESRFRLVFSSNMANAEMGEDFAFFSNGQLVIANEGEAILQVIDVTGRVVATESINGTCSKAINAKAGVYVLRLINGTDVKTQKMVIDKR